MIRSFRLRFVAAVVAAVAMAVVAVGRRRGCHRGGRGDRRGCHRCPVRPRHSLPHSLHGRVLRTQRVAGCGDMRNPAESMDSRSH
eukprot:gene12552-biopygen1802